MAPTKKHKERKRENKGYDHIRREKDQLSKASLNAKKEEQLLSLLADDINKTNTEKKGVDFSDKKLSKQIETVLKELVEFQFTSDQAGLAIRSCAGTSGGITTSNALDCIGNGICRCLLRVGRWRSAKSIRKVRSFRGKRSRCQI